MDHAVGHLNFWCATGCHLILAIGGAHAGGGFHAELLFRMAAAAIGFTSVMTC